MIRTLRELISMCRGLSSGAYPAFVTQRSLGGEIPVFLYHREDPARIGADFAFLQRNGYRTLHADEHREALSRPPVPDERRVVVTFDDGLTELYEQAFPAMQRCDVRAVVFLIPARVGQPGMVTWDQVRRMHESGLVDFQSHSMHHAAIPTSPEIVDFHHPGRHYYCPWDAPVDARWRDGVPAFPPPLGFPIFRHGSRLEDSLRFVPAEEYEASFSRHVARAGGVAFFENRSWRAELRVLMRSSEEVRAAGRTESDDEQREAMRVELLRSRERIEAELGAKRVRHFAYPWNRHGQRVESLLAEAGYELAYAGLTPHRGPASLRDGRYSLSRVPGDFLPMLPGEGRAGLLSTLAYKAWRRVTTGLPY